ncbi:MAG: hypothetical protein H7831_02320 [Magnetococcus sp. WYHC-3]
MRTKIFKPAALVLAALVSVAVLSPRPAQAGATATMGLILGGAAVAGLLIHSVQPVQPSASAASPTPVVVYPYQQPRPKVYSAPPVIYTSAYPTQQPYYANTEVVPSPYAEAMQAGPPVTPYVLPR